MQDGAAGSYARDGLQARCREGRASGQSAQHGVWHGGRGWILRLALACCHLALWATNCTGNAHARRPHATTPALLLPLGSRACVHCMHARWGCEGRAGCMRLHGRLTQRRVRQRLAHRPGDLLFGRAAHITVRARLDACLQAVWGKLLLVPRVGNWGRLSGFCAAVARGRPALCRIGVLHHARHRTPLTQGWEGKRMPSAGIATDAGTTSPAGAGGPHPSHDVVWGDRTAIKVEQWVRLGEGECGGAPEKSLPHPQASQFPTGAMARLKAANVLALVPAGPLGTAIKLAAAAVAAIWWTSAPGADEER